MSQTRTLNPRHLGQMILVLLFSFIVLSTQAKPKQEYYELRTYTLTSPEQRQGVEAYWQNAAIPALNKMGIKNVGVFREMEPGETPKLYVLIPYKSLQQFEAVQSKFFLEPAHQKAGDTYINAPFKQPAYQRIESSLMKAFTHLPELEVPAKKDRIFELRVYESHSEKFAKQKIKMFNEGGEIEIFRKTGLQPVFFGETLVGTQMPNLTYMITAPSMEAHKQHWKQFGQSPEWKELSSLPEYADTVSEITSVFLVPTSFSQI
ncbi:NIPSNAP family protein [Pontibacter korlensis]|nr:NIPSNAP family protein [Pontibacter korlensis]